ncbi:hypothetical protein C5470_21440, partial [Photorhabdus stackebrandtii]|nr:hypothetical protein [Photorhabdus stackebrandtii]
SIREGIYPGVKHVGLPGHYQALVRLEPCALKGARTVLRGLETGNCLWLLCEIVILAIPQPASCCVMWLLLKIIRHCYNSLVGFEIRVLVAGN